MSTTIIKCFALCVACLTTCAFSPADIVFKNLKLIPDPMDKADKYPHLPKNYTNAKSEKLWKQPKLPTIKSDKPAENVVSIKKITNTTFQSVPDDVIKSFTPTMKDLDYAFNLSNIGIKTTANDKGGGLQVGFLEKETAKLPILNDLPGMPYLYNKKTPVVKSIKDIRIPGLDDVLPTKVGEPLKPKDYDIQSHLDFFNDYTTPDKVLNQSIFDVLP